MQLSHWRPASFNVSAEAFFSPSKKKIKCGRICTRHQAVGGATKKKDSCQKKRLREGKKQLPSQTHTTHANVCEPERNPGIGIFQSFRRTPL